VKSPGTFTAGFLCSSLLLCGALTALGAPQAPSAELRALASKAGSRSGWVPLLGFADSAKDPEQRGLAYFALGYQEFDADSYDFAIKNFKNAAQIDFSLADYAQYYWAAAAQEANQPKDVLEALAEFPKRFPESPLRQDALELYARTLLDTNQARRAAEVLQTDSHVRAKPSLALLLANAYRQLGNAEEAARIYQDIYFGQPTSYESEPAGNALEALRLQLGDKFPAVPEAIQTARAYKLYSSGRYRKAIDAYEVLLRTYSKSSLSARWKVGRARCLYRLRRTSEALDALQAPVRDNPEADAERLSTLVDIYVRQDDPDSIDVILKQLARLYPTTLAYASALDSAGDYYVRRSNWPRAASYYDPIATQFAGSEWGLEANWRLAWSYYLAKDRARAREAFLDHLRRYPDSWHTAGALYWLASLAETDGTSGTALKLDEALVKRFGQSYYAARAKQRIAELSKTQSADMPVRDAAWLQARALAQQLPLLGPPPVSPCVPTETNREVARFRTLLALSLDDLAEEALRSSVSDHPERPKLLIALSQFEANHGKLGPGLLDAVRAVSNYSEFEFDALPKQVWDLLYPRAYWSLVQQEASTRGVDPYLVMGLIRQESAFDPNAVSSANARGLMQILPQTATRQRSRRRSAARQLMDPDYNVRMGTDLLGKLSSTFQGNMEQVMAAYHAGQSRVNSWKSQFAFQDQAEFLETIPIPATRVYVERVLRDSGVYRKLLTGVAGFADCHLPHQEARDDESGSAIENKTSSWGQPASSAKPSETAKDPAPNT
jgi:peptidoglycan lytic transglycosylase